MRLAYKRWYPKAGHADGYLSRPKALRDTCPWDLPLDITLNARDTSGPIFIIWYNPFPKMILNTFGHWWAPNTWHISGDKSWTPGTDGYPQAGCSFLTYIFHCSALKICWLGSFIKSMNAQGSAYLMIDSHTDNVYLSIPASILPDFCHNSGKSMLQLVRVTRRYLCIP